MPLALRICLLPPSLTILIILAVPFAFSGLGFWIRVRLLTHDRLKELHAVGGILFNLVSVLYAVVVASVAVGAWEQFEQATLVAEQEAGSMLAVTRIVKLHPHPSPDLQHLKHCIHAYAEAVVEREFPAMARLERSPETVEAFQAVWQAAIALAPSNAQESNIQQAILTHLGDAQRARVGRLLAAHRGLPGSLWLVLAFGTAVTLLFSLFFSTEEPWAQAGMLAAVTLVTALSVYAIITLNYPFAGSTSVKPEGWVFVLRHAA